MISGIILAAGAAQRMGRPKQLLPLAGRPLLQHVIDAAAGSSSLGELVLVLGHDAAKIRAAVTLPRDRPTRVVINPEYEQGQSTSLRLGLGATDAGATAAAVLLGDQPGVTTALIDRVAAAFNRGGVPMARPVWQDRDGDRIPGHPVFLAHRIWPTTDGLRGDQGARALLADHPEWLLEVAIAGEAPADIDDPDDYARAVDALATATIRG